MPTSVFNSSCVSLAGLNRYLKRVCGTKMIDEFEAEDGSAVFLETAGRKGANREKPRNILDLRGAHEAFFSGCMASLLFEK